MIGFPIGALLANAGEWLIHKYVLHGLGRRKKSIWAFHWHEHHRASRRNDFRDDDYFRSPLGWNAQGKEVYGILGLSASVLPLAPWAPWFCAGVWTSAAAYYAVHKKSHLDPEWARRWLPWHYDHHMGPNQDANWCVTYPLFDHVMGTREPYLGTERELRDRERANRKQAVREARAA
jgi:sterol desaturase/sphingolipid hydroxylase (fatty acid hydroxylase superfamily)